MNTIVLHDSEFGDIEFNIIPPGSTHFLSPSSHFRKGTRNISNIPKGNRIWNITKPYAVSRKVITRRLYTTIIGRPGPWETRANDRYRKNDESPANYLSYADALEFCKTLSNRTGKLINLPTELMFEHYSSGGVSNDFYWSDMNYDSDECVKQGIETAHFVHRGAITRLYNQPPLVGELTPNQFGIQDSIGLICEWVRDGYSGNGLLVDQTENLHKTASDVVFNAGKRRILKGGMYSYPLRSNGRWERNSFFHDNAHESFAGLRVVIDHP